MKKLLVLGASEFQIPLYIQAKKMGVYTCAVDINENAKGFDYANEHRVCNIKNIEDVFNIAKKFQPDGITAGMVDIAVNTVSIIANRLGLPGLKPEIAKRASDKLLMIQSFKAEGVPHPQYLFFDNKTEIKYSNILIPSIVKPIDMAGSRGINHISSVQDISKAVQDSIRNSDTGKVILEEYMTGPEVSVEIVVKGSEPFVVQITDKLTSGVPHFMELGHSQPSKFMHSLKKQISDVACAAVKSLKLSNCIVHAELIITEHGPKMVELGARMGGDAIHQYLLEYSTGINMQEIAIKIAFGESFEVPHDLMNKASAIRFLQSREGVVKKITIDPRIYEKAKKVEIYCKIGDKCVNAKDNSGRLGYVITQADTADIAISECEKIINYIEIEIE